MPQHVFIISDGTGGTAQQALKAALVQFEKTEVLTHIRPNIRHEKEVLKIISEAKQVKGVILHTIVSKKIRDLILEQGLLNDVGTIDLMGPLLAHLANNFDHSPTEKPGIFHKLNRAYFQRIEAVEFTLRHDDGQREEELDKADIILLGVSRTFKTPISVYMAHKGWKVANIPIILGFPLPEIIFKIPTKRVFCLTTNPTSLSSLRQVRDKHLGGGTGDYSNRSYVQKELNYALRMYKLHPHWAIINVTNKPIEEISSEILSSLRKRGKKI